MAAEAPAPLDLSLVCPVYNEVESLDALVAEVQAALGPSGLRYELICVDDGSRDGSFEKLRALAAAHPQLTALRLRRNFGQTAAMQAGLDAARGRLVALMDADLQNDPKDIPSMVARLGPDCDLVAGWRKDRQDAFLNRRLPSILANRLIGFATGVRLHDYGCTLKVMTREIAKDLRLYGEMHRFIPAIASATGAQVVEQAVGHRARRFGKSKYGIGRTLRVVLDLMTVVFLHRYLARPMQIFGLAGLGSFGLGFLLCAGLALEKLLRGTDIGTRPLLLLGVLLIVVGIQLVSLGLVADLVARTYHEAQRKPPYTLRERIGGEPPA